MVGRAAVLIAVSVAAYPIAVPLRGVCWMTLATCAAAQQAAKKPPSLSELEARARQDSLDPEAHFRLATRYYQLKRWADEDCGAATTEFLAVLGLGAFGASRYELAYNALDMWAQRTFASKPADSIPDFLFLYRGLSAGKLRAYNKAIADIQVLYDRSLKAERTDSLLPVPMRTNDYRYLLGVLNQLWGKHWVAVKLFEETLAADLGLYMAHVRLAQVYRSLKLWDKAVAEARRALETNPNEGPAMRELGLLLDEAGRTEDAAVLLEQAAAASPRDPGTVYHLGLVQQKLARSAQAQESLTRFVGMAPAARYERELTDAKQRLGALQP
jgi:tetratricopeptide (TPR) repeat protein